MEGILKKNNCNLLCRAKRLVKTETGRIPFERQNITCSLFLCLFIIVIWILPSSLFVCFQFGRSGSEYRRSFGYVYINICYKSQKDNICNIIINNDLRNQFEKNHFKIISVSVEFTNHLGNFIRT